MDEEVSDLSGPGRDSVGVASDFFAKEQLMNHSERPEDTPGREEVADSTRIICRVLVPGAVR
jgi:hypothetical protein